jgi:hypothetical protein
MVLRRAQLSVHLALQDFLIHRPKQDFYLINPSIIESQTTPTNTAETSDSLSTAGELGVAGIIVNEGLTEELGKVQPWCKRKPVNLRQMVHGRIHYFHHPIAIAIG